MDTNLKQSQARIAYSNHDASERDYKRVNFSCKSEPQNSA